MGWQSVKFHEASLFLQLVFQSIILLREPDPEGKLLAVAFTGSLHQLWLVLFVCLFVCLFINLHYGITTGKIALTENNNSRLNLTRGKKSFETLYTP